MRDKNLLYALTRVYSLSTKICSYLLSDFASLVLFRVVGWADDL